MRRARIKAVANVPIRRKATQDGTTPQSTNPSSPVEKDSDEGSRATAENAICSSELDKRDFQTNDSKLPSPIEISDSSPELQVPSEPSLEIEPPKQNSDVSNKNTEECIVKSGLKDVDLEKHDNSQKGKTEQTAVSLGTQILNPIEQSQEGKDTVARTSSEKLSCDKTEDNKKLAGKQPIATIIGRRRFKPTVKLAASRGGNKDKVGIPYAEKVSPANVKTVNNLENQLKLPKVTSSDSEGTVVPFSSLEDNLTNSDLESRRSISQDLSLSQSSKTNVSSLPSSINPSGVINTLYSQKKTASSDNLFELGLSDISALNEKGSDGPASNNIRNLELSQISARNEKSEKCTTPGSNSSQNPTIVPTTNKSQNLISEKSQGQTFATMRSPDNTFAGLRSPPYRSEPFKSDSYSLKSPMSPSKLLQNRSRFVRPVPRLDGGGRIRRNSVQGSGASASESEDDCRRSNSTIPNRMRNDSVCSVQSNREAVVNVGLNNLSQSHPGQKRRMVVSESARKLAEARREFLIKHGNKAPDRNKLTMYDLIYYNPVTNPMKRPSESAPVSRRNSVCSSAGSINQDEENVDEPPQAMPVPQVKVGPDGQLIIDEQSLIIEQTGTQKSREALANSEAVIDEGGTGNGFYKRRQKSKEWPKWETLRFYKALNTIGTDFLLMQSLFPKRTRQEIKLKFKKEEKTNRQLVEKALMYHQEFDIDTLEEELAAFEERERKELEAKEREKEMKKQLKETSKTVKKEKNISRFVVSSIEEEGETEDEVGSLEIPLVEEPVISEKPKKRIKRKRIIEEAINDLMRGASTFVNNSDSDPEIYERKPTRSGRVPKVRKLQAPEVNKLDNASAIPSKSIGEDMNSGLENLKTEGVQNDLEVSSEESNESVEEPKVLGPSIPDLNHVEPGSLVILSSESSEEPGKTVMQVYMVSPNTDPSDSNAKRNMTPIDLSPELLATVTTKLSQVEPINLKTKHAINIV